MNHHDDPKRALHKAIWLPCCTYKVQFYTYKEEEWLLSDDPGFNVNINNDFAFENISGKINR